MGKILTIDKDTALVLEGGGMRGIFTGGVLDNFIDRGLYFPYTVGVSAGAANGLNFMGRQRERSKQIDIDLLEKYHYIGLKYLLTQRNIMDFNLLFDQIPEYIIPFDYKTYEAARGRFEMVTTSCRTGHAVYLEEKHDHKRIIDIVRASCSLPFGCPVAYVDGEPMLDGGIADSIPVQHAFDLGYKRAVVVLTRNRGYRKEEKKYRIPRFVYSDYPRMRAALRMRSIIYNRELELVERLEDEGRVVVIRPQKTLEVGRMESDVRKLQALYDEGLACAAAMDIRMDGGGIF